jgi:2-oxoglutarate/2-oxoacid ferredoxin oxidoreductase subunit beta
MSTQKTVNGSQGNGNLQSKDFASDQEVRWCPGCGDYTILKQVQNLMPKLGLDPENIVFIAGIGCSSRFPYYMDTYGIHGIHGRAPAIATGLKVARPDLSVWVVTGDGDALSIGGNHIIHLLRRNLDINVLLFNNEIYGLTKGQYSPTSPQGLVTKTSPGGSADSPFNPLALALGANGSFVARAMDRDPKHLQAMLERTAGHKGTSFLEIYQNCIVFNDGAFSPYTDKSLRDNTSLYLEDGQPLLFGADDAFGVRLDGCKPEIVDLRSGKWSKDDLWIHDEHDRNKAWLLTSLFDDNSSEGKLPRPFGVLLADERPAYEELVKQQIAAAIERKGDGDLEALLTGEETWTVKG